MKTENQMLTDVLFGLEGNEYDFYVPKNKEGTAIGESGITIGKGFDLGAQNEKSLRNMGIPEPLIKKLVDSGYLGKKKDDAIKALNEGSLKLSGEEVDQINSAAIPYYTRQFEAALKKNTGLDAQTDLTTNQRIALTSAYFNLGNGLFYNKNNKKTSLSNQLANKQWELAGENIATWSKNPTPGLQARREAEANLLLGNFGVEDLVQFRDSRSKQLIAERDAAKALEIAQTEPENQDLPTLQEYVVQKGDTLYNIAKQTGRTVAEIVDQNNIINPDQIQPGQSLLL